MSGSSIHRKTSIHWKYRFEKSEESEGLHGVREVHLGGVVAVVAVPVHADGADAEVELEGGSVDFFVPNAHKSIHGKQKGRTSQIVCIFKHPRGWGTGWFGTFQTIFCLQETSYFDVNKRWVPNHPVYHWVEFLRVQWSLLNDFFPVSRACRSQRCRRRFRCPRWIVRRWSRLRSPRPSWGATAAAGIINYT